MSQEVEIAELIRNTVFILLIPLAFLLGPVILRAACFLCGVEVPEFVRAWWVSVLAWTLTPILGNVLSWLTSIIGPFLGKSLLLTVTVSQPSNLVVGEPFFGNAILLSLFTVTGADMRFPGPLFSGWEEIETLGGQPSPRVARTEISVVGTLINLNIVMVAMAGIYHLLAGLPFSRALQVWLVDLFIKLQLIGFVVLMIVLVSVLTRGSG